MRIRLMHPRNLIRLPRRKRLRRIQAPDPRQKPLPMQNLMNSGDASGKSVLRIKKRRIAVRHLNIARQQLPPERKNRFQ